MAGRSTTDRRPPDYPGPGRWSLFVRRFGWRACALPLLSVVTVATLVKPQPDDEQARGRPATDAPAARPAVVASPATPTTATPQQHGAAGTEQPANRATSVTVAADDGLACADNGHRQLVLVSVSAQHLWACNFRREVTQTPVTTGASWHGHGTPLGSWRLQGKQRNRYLTGPGYRDFVRYWMPFNGDFGLHDASWQRIPFGSTAYHERGSHGCVHVPTDVMGWLYRWSRVSETVVMITD